MKRIILHRIENGILEDAKKSAFDFWYTKHDPTGVSKGIGAAIAKSLAGEAASVVVNYASSKAQPSVCPEGLCSLD